jgi:hypothetical protein
VTFLRRTEPAVIGAVGYDRFNQAFENAHYELNTTDPEVALYRAMVTSGYADSRRRMFPD